MTDTRSASNPQPYGRGNFLSPAYLLQQLKVASFLGIVATGMMLVILLGQIDLSVPWVITVGAMMACAAAGYGTVGAVLAVPFGYTPKHVSEYNPDKLITHYDQGWDAIQELFGDS